MAAFDNARVKLWNGVFGEELEPNLVATAFVNDDITKTSEILSYGDTVHVNFLGEVEIGDYTPNEKMNGPQILDSTDAVLVIDNRRKFNFFVDDCDESQVRPDIMAKAMQKSARSMAKRIDTDIFNVIADAAPEANTIGGDTPVELTGDNIYAYIVKAKNILDKNDVPDQGRKLAINPDIEALMLLDKRFVAAGVPQSEERLENGLVFRVLGFDVFKSNNVPAGKIIASNNMATTHVHQLSKLDLYTPEDLFGTAAKGLEVYGTKVFYPSCVAVINYKVEDGKAYYVGTPDATQAWDAAVGTAVPEGTFEHDNVGYFLTTDTTKDGSKTYFNLFNEVENPEGNPAENGWYVYTESEGWEGYAVTTDTTVQTGTTYYTKVTTVG